MNKTRKALEGMSLCSEGTRGYASHLVCGPCALWGLSPKGLQAFRIGLERSICPLSCECCGCICEKRGEGAVDVAVSMCTLSLPPWKVCMLVILSLSLFSLIIDGGERERENGGLKGREVALKGREGVVLLHYVYTYSSCMCVCGVVWCGVWGGSSSNTLPPLSTLTYTHTHTHTHTLRSISHLVDPASSHMLSSKAKPCMSKYKGFCPKLRTAHYNGRNLNGPIPFPSRITLGI